jgi:hypothetical protein
VTVLRRYRWTREWDAELEPIAEEYRGWFGGREPASAGLTGRQAAAAAGITYRQLDYWVTLYADELALEVGNPGSGVARAIPRRVMPRLHVAARLVELGLSPTRVFALDHQARLRLRATMVKVLTPDRGERRRAREQLRAA